MLKVILRKLTTITNMAPQIKRSLTFQERSLTIKKLICLMYLKQKRSHKRNNHMKSLLKATRTVKVQGEN